MPFSTAPGNLVQSNLTKSENATFNCCNTSWVIVDGSSLKRIISTENITASVLIFLCGEEGDDSNMLVVKSIGYLKFDKQENLNVISILTNASGDSKASNDSSDDFQCQIITFYMDTSSKGRSLSITVTPGTSTITASQDKPSTISNNTLEDETKIKRKELIILITIIVITGIALTLSIGVHLGNYLLKIRRKERCGRKDERNISSRMNSATNFGNIAAESVEMTASSGVSRPGRDVSCRQTSDREET